MMKNTFANVEALAKSEGYEPIQIDGIPEGFSFKKPDIEIGGVLHVGHYTAFVPNYFGQIYGTTTEVLLEFYNLAKAKQLRENGK